MRTIDGWTGDIHVADAFDVVGDLPQDSVDTVVTSTPYWGKIDYGVEGQLGLEEKAFEFVDRLVELFDALAGVVDHEGSVWLNIADTFNGNTIIRESTATSHPRKGDSGYEDQLAANRGDSGVKRRSSQQFGQPRRAKLMIPDRAALAISNETDWFLREEIVWSKPDPKPEGRVSTRLTQASETIYRFVQSEHATFDDSRARSSTNVWEIPTAKTSDHPAAYPTELPERCIELTTTPGDVVLDPFAGSGSTCVAADRLDREFVGIELNPDFAAAARGRLGDDSGRGLGQWMPSD